MSTSTKKGVVRAGRTVHLGEKKGNTITSKPYGPGATVTVEKDEYDRLVEAGALAKPGSPEARVALATADVLPADFPGYGDLTKAGIDTYSDLEEIEDKTSIKGIGDATAAEIEKALKAREE